MRRVVAKGAGHAREQILVALTRQEIAVIERGLAEIRQQRVARAVDLNLAMTFELDRIEHCDFPIKSPDRSMHDWTVPTQYIGALTRS